MAETPAMPVGYRSAWEADVVLRDGSVAHVRPIRPADADLLRAFHAGQSEESIYLRFFAPLRELSDRDVERFTVVDYDDRVALVAMIGEHIIGIGRYDKVDNHTAEVAFNISDHFQGKGIGSVLLEHLSAIGIEAGLGRFVAEVLPQNRKMLNVFKEAGYAVKHRLEDGVITVSFDINPTDQSKAVRMAREHRAESVSVRRLLSPRSVAVVGAGRNDSSVGHLMLADILAGGFTGAVYAVNPAAHEVQGIPCYAKVSDIPGEVDLAVLCVPAEMVLDVVKDCAAKQVQDLVVISAGFAESGERGRALQKKLAKRVRRNGMRLVGPNSFGIINNNDDVRLNASLAPQLPPRGTLGLFAQSGPLGIGVLASAARRNLGISVFVSAGNRADVSGNDVMQYWIDDKDTDAIGLYIETTGNPRKFSRIARHLSQNKPVIVVRSVSATVTGPGHEIRRASLGPDAFEALLQQAGVIRADNIHQLFDIAQLVVHQPLPAGERVAVVGNSDALGSLTAQAALSWGLNLTHGPASVAPDASVAEFAQALGTALQNPQVDSVLISFVPPVVTYDEEVAAVVRDESARFDKPCVATFLGMHGVTEALASSGSSGPRRRVVPAYPMPEDAVAALAAVVRYSQWRERDKGTPVAPEGIDRAGAEGLIDDVLLRDPAGRELTAEEAARLLACYGISVWPSRLVGTAEEAVAAAEELGYPIIIKGMSPQLRHQVGVGGVRPDLGTPAGVRDGFASLSGRLGTLADDRFAIQSMSPPGVACVVGSTEDPLFGPVVTFSIAGPPTDLLGDIGYRIPPLTDVDVSDLILSVRAAAMLLGHGGRQRVDMQALFDLVGRVSVLAENHPNLASVALNPVNCWVGGVDVLGAEITVRPAQVRTDADRRSMT
jgi:acyl-CoA synthetase (NDP forming)/RimJ/RimL family protein N-acetyltransferase